MLRLEGKLIISMSQTAYSKTTKVNIDHAENQSVELSSVSQFSNIKTRKGEKRGFSPGNGVTLYLGYCFSCLWFIFTLLHPRNISKFFIHVAGSNPIVLSKKAGIVSCGVPFLFIVLLVNLPVTAAGQDIVVEEEPDTVVEEEPQVDPFRIPADDAPAAINDPNLQIEEIATDLNHPTAMAFLGSSDDIIVADKDNGTVRRIIGGVIQPEPLVDVAVANNNDTNERGLLGMAVARQNETSTYVFLYYTESGGGQDGDDSNRIVPAGNRLYRYELVENANANSTSAELINPKLLLDLPARPGPRYNGGPLLVTQNQNDTIVYLMIGDLDHRLSQAENYEDGPPPDGTGGILAVDAEGNALASPLLVAQVDGDEENGDEENGDEENGDEENGDEENGDEENGDEENG